MLLESLLPKGFGEPGFTEISYNGEPILQDQFDGLSEVVDDSTNTAEYGSMEPGKSPAELWRATRKELMGEDKGDDVS